MNVKHSSYVCSLGLQTLALSFTRELSFLFYQSTVLSSHAVNWMIIKCISEVGSLAKASTSCIEISPTPPQIFTGGEVNQYEI